MLENLGEGIILRAVRGEVVGQRTDRVAETSRRLSVDHSRGGSSHVDTKVSERSKHTLFLQLPDGSERPIRIEDVEPIWREGHECVGYVAQGPDRETGLWITNLTTGERVERLQWGLQHVRGAGAFGEIGRLALWWVGILFLLGAAIVVSEMRPSDREGALVVVAIGAGLLGLSAASAQSSWRWQHRVREIIEAHDLNIMGLQRYPADEAGPASGGGERDRQESK